jgi:glycosyl transferase family 25
MSSIKKLDYIYVLNVKKFTERRAFMEAQLTKLGMKAEFILDGDIEELTDDIISRYFVSHNNLSAAQMSCAMKHVFALQKIAQNYCTFNLVLEDDAIFAKDFLTGLQHTLDESINFIGDKVIYIGSGGNFFTPKSQRKKGQHLYLGSRGRFADSYIIDSETAKKRLLWIEQHKISEPIDNQFEKIDKQLGVKMVWLEEPIVEQGSKNGLFNSALEPSPPQWLQAILFKWEKLKRKYIYQLWR